MAAIAIDAENLSPQTPVPARKAAQTGLKATGPPLSTPSARRRRSIGSPTAPGSAPARWLEATWSGWDELEPVLQRRPSSIFDVRVNAVNSSAHHVQWYLIRLSCRRGQRRRPHAALKRAARTHSPSPRATLPRAQAAAGAELGGGPPLLPIRRPRLRAPCRPQPAGEAARATSEDARAPSLADRTPAARGGAAKMERARAVDAVAGGAQSARRLLLPRLRPLALTRPLTAACRRGARARGLPAPGGPMRIPAPSVRAQPLSVGLAHPYHLYPPGFDAHRPRRPHALPPRRRDRPRAERSARPRRPPRVHVARRVATSALDVRGVAVGDKRSQCGPLWLRPAWRTTSTGQICDSNTPLMDRERAPLHGCPMARPYNDVTTMNYTHLHGPCGWMRMDAWSRAAVACWICRVTATLCSDG